MMLTTIAKLEVPPEDRDRLLAAIRNFNGACNWLSQIAFIEKLFKWLPLQRRAYFELRQRFGLTSKQAVVCVRKVSYAYCKMKGEKRCARFRPLGAMPLYAHSYKPDGTIRFYGFEFPIKARPGITLSSDCEARLVVRGELFLVHQAFEGRSPEPSDVTDFLGVDLGIRNIAVDSDGEPFSGAQLSNLRRRHAALRSGLQSKKTRSARRLLKRRRNKERRFAANLNHWISKRLVAKARASLRGIALENLKGIRERITTTKPHRRALTSWAFGQLRLLIVYKARLAGVPVVFVDPRNTSRTCPECGRVDRRNRRNDEFKCVGCGHAGQVDWIAAVNIRRAAQGTGHTR